jgi:hypothetical protein
VAERDLSNDVVFKLGEQRVPLTGTDANEIYGRAVSANIPERELHSALLGALRADPAKRELDVTEGMRPALLDCLAAIADDHELTPAH